MSAFSSLDLTPALLHAVEGLGYVAMTPVQAAALPPILAGRDVIAQARTGSGKTAAFGLGLLARLDPAAIALQALVLCPTRELADQVSKDIRRLATAIPNVKLLTLCGGISLRPQLASLTHVPHIVVGTPGRIQELLRNHAMTLDALRVLVLDEADRMLDMGFHDAIAEIAAAAPARRQTLLFSATYPESIRALGTRFQHDALEVTVGEGDSDGTIEQHFFRVEPARKPDALLALLAAYRPAAAVVFCNTRKDVDAVADALWKRGVPALALHGDLDQRERDETLVRFANRSCPVLVATDVAARGLDIKDLPAVISYELASDADMHLHRIGRTGRAGQAGLALSLVAERETGRVAAIEQRSDASVAWAPLPRAGKPLPPAEWITLVIDAGRSDKLRPGDVLGALTGEAGLKADMVGKIDVFATRAYVAVARQQAERALERLRAGKIKGRNFRVRKLG